MIDFRSWCEEKVSSFAWKAKKPEIVNYWSKLPPSLPVQPFNIPPANYRGSSYMYDGIRITGSRQFIDSVASKLKDVLKFDSGNTKLMLRYYQQIDKNTDYPLPNSYVFYAQIRNKGEDQR